MTNKQNKKKKKKKKKKEKNGETIPDVPREYE